MGRLRLGRGHAGRPGRRRPRRLRARVRDLLGRRGQAVRPLRRRGNLRVPRHGHHAGLRPQRQLRDQLSRLGPEGRAPDRHLRVGPRDRRRRPAAGPGPEGHLRLQRDERHARRQGRDAEHHQHPERRRDRRRLRDRRDQEPGRRLHRQGGVPEEHGRRRQGEELHGLRDGGHGHAHVVDRQGRQRLDERARRRRLGVRGHRQVRTSHPDLDRQVLEGGRGGRLRVSARRRRQRRRRERGLGRLGRRPLAGGHLQDARDPGRHRELGPDRHDRDGRHLRDHAQAALRRGQARHGVRLPREPRPAAQRRRRARRRRHIPRAGPRLHGPRGRVVHGRPPRRQHPSHLGPRHLPPHAAGHGRDRPQQLRDQLRRRHLHHHPADGHGERHRARRQEVRRHALAHQVRRVLARRSRVHRGRARHHDVLLRQPDRLRPHGRVQGPGLRRRAGRLRHRDQHRRPARDADRRGNQGRVLLRGLQELPSQAAVRQREPHGREAQDDRDGTARDDHVRPGGIRREGRRQLLRAACGRDRRGTPPGRKAPRRRLLRLELPPLRRRARRGIAGRAHAHAQGPGRRQLRHRLRRRAAYGATAPRAGRLGGRLLRVRRHRARGLRARPERPERRRHHARRLQEQPRDRRRRLPRERVDALGGQGGQLHDRPLLRRHPRLDHRRQPERDRRHLRRRLDLRRQDLRRLRGRSPQAHGNGHLRPGGHALRVQPPRRLLAGHGHPAQRAPDRRGHLLRARGGRRNGGLRRGRERADELHHRTREGGRRGEGRLGALRGRPHSRKAHRGAPHRRQGGLLRRRPDRPG